jgi:predicted DNA-binding protein
MNRTPKSGQLRVRLNPADHERLAQLALKRDKGGTVSEVVRNAIEQLLGNDGEGSDITLGGISNSTRDHLFALAKELNRTPAQVLEDCVEGIFDLVEKKATPLIAQELELRRKYYLERESRSQAETQL